MRTHTDMHIHTSILTYERTYISVHAQTSTHVHISTLQLPTKTHIFLHLLFFARPALSCDLESKLSSGFAGDSGSLGFERQPPELPKTLAFMVKHLKPQVINLSWPQTLAATEGDQPTISGLCMDTFEKRQKHKAVCQIEGMYMMEAKCTLCVASVASALTLNPKTKVPQNI